jgi:hypothetical protein
MPHQDPSGNNSPTLVSRMAAGAKTCRSPPRSELAGTAAANTDASAADGQGCQVLILHPRKADTSESYSKDVWETLKPQLHEFYIERRLHLPMVMWMMAQEHDFHPR